MLSYRLIVLGFAIAKSRSTAAINATVLQPCALVSSALASSASSTSIPTSDAEPPQFTVDASMAYACLQSVPLDKTNATIMIDGLTAFWTFHSTQAWLKDPPATYPVPGVNIMAKLGSIRASVVNGSMTGEYSLQKAIQDLINSAADGHFDYKMDLLNVFAFNHDMLGSVVAVSDDGMTVPLSYYTFNDLKAKSWSKGSAIVAVNGLPAAEYFDTLRSSALYADPDAQLAYVFGDIARMDNQPYNGIFADGRAGLYFGNATTLTFANGTNHTYQNFATTTKDFRNVDSGSAFYREYCSPPDKTALILDEFLDNKSTKPSASSGNVRAGYPYSTYTDSSGTIAGYFLNGSDVDTAVLSISSFVSGDGPTEAAQRTLADFLATCRTMSKTRLIIDVTSNNGGNSLLPFDFFKQLFPSIAPYNVQNARAHAGYNALGSAVSSSVASAGLSGNLSQYAGHGGFSSFDVASFTAPDTSAIDWSELYGPQMYHGDNFTNLFGRRYFQSNYTEYAGSLVISGYGDRSIVPPQAFQSDNIILMTNGACDSACALFAHFLKYQGKVKQITIGGRPKTGPMQAVGGTRGTQVQPLLSILGYTYEVLNQSTPGNVSLLAQTELGTIARNGPYVLARAIDVGEANVNFYNHIAQNDSSLTPLQFTYEAADCRIFYTTTTAVNVSASWSKVAEVWKAGFETCVAGSTNQPSSLSGNPKLYNDGVPTNVSAFQMPGNRPSPNSNNITSYSPATSGSHRVLSRWTPWLVVTAASVSMCSH